MQQERVPFVSEMTGALMAPTMIESQIAASYSNQEQMSFLQPQRGSPGGREDRVSNFEFMEFNGMKTASKFTNNLAEYLKQRKGWVGMIVENRTAKTIRSDHIVYYISKGHLNQGQTLVLVKALYAEQFRTGLRRNGRSIEENIRTGERTKRQKI
jgi:hypothetical protein